MFPLLSCWTIMWYQLPNTNGLFLDRKENTMAMANIKRTTNGST